MNAWRLLQGVELGIPQDEELPDITALHPWELPHHEGMSCIRCTSFPSLAAEVRGS